MLACDDSAVAEAARLIRSGELVAVPTETVYGLAGDATSEAAVARIYAAKGRPSFNPLIVHVASLEEAGRLGIFCDQARALASALWPGALTLVVPAREDGGLARAVTAGLPTVALRCPSHPAMRALLAAAGRPLAAPSANASGAISPTRAGHVLAGLGGRIAMILDGGPTERGIESTIVAVRDGSVRLLRPGPISLDEIEAALSPSRKEGAGGGSAGGGRNSESAKVSPRSSSRPEQARHAPGRTGDVRGTSAPAHPLPSSEGSVEAPGQLASHYAPSKPLRLDVTDPAPGEWLIGFGPVECDDNLSPSGNLDEAAARLFDALHRADAQPGPRIAVAPIPNDGVGFAMNDRLRRAAAPRGKS
ncbi:MAG TPA: L-threonylcarbamoyladenylate synthase [Allosphingosinicella sp.]|jgi:L-threonylcarbamoyladenylate synthase